MGVIWNREGFIGRARKYEISYLGAAHRSPVGTRSRVDGPAESQGGLPNLGTGAHVPENGGVEFSMNNHDGIIADAWLSGGFSDHEGGKHDEGIRRSDKEIPAFEFLGSSLEIVEFLDQ